MTMTMTWDELRQGDNRRRLTEEQVAEVRRLYHEDNETYQAIAWQLGIGMATVGCIIRDEASTRYHRTIRPLMECGYSSDERSVIARMACYRSAEDAERASAALLLRFERLDRLAANYGVSDVPDEAA